MAARLLYSLIFYLLTPLIALRLLWRGRLVRGYWRRWRERFGWVERPEGDRPIIWVHAVSVGETMAAAPLIRHLQRLYPGWLIAVTTTTPTGSERVKASLGDSVYHSYAPYDLPDAVVRFLGRVKPRLLIIMETELWTNLIHSCRHRDIPVVVANARLSAKSAAGYRRFAWLTRSMLKKISVVAAQSAEDGQRFLSLGLPADRLKITGNIKFDLDINEEEKNRAMELGRQWRGESGRPVWLAASTHKGEDELIFSAFKTVLQSHPQALLVLVPRHPDRFQQVAALGVDQGFKLVRRSTGQPPGDDTQVLLGDSMGELPLFFGGCDLAFVGGSLVPVGGHNLLEAAVWGIPVLSGPHLHNFAEVSTLLLAAGGLEICASEKALGDSVCRLLGDGLLRRQQGEAARAVVDANRGAMEKLLAVIAQLKAQSPGWDRPRR